MEMVVQYTEREQDIIKSLNMLHKQEMDRLKSTIQYIFHHELDKIESDDDINMQAVANMRKYLEVL